MLICPSPGYRRGPKKKEAVEEKAKLRGRYRKLDSLPILLALGRRGPKLLIVLVMLGALGTFGAMNGRLISAATAKTQSLIAFASNRASGQTQTKANPQATKQIRRRR